MAAEKHMNDSVFTDMMNPKFVQKDMKLLGELKKMSISDYFTLYTTKEKSSGFKVYCELWDNIIIIKESPIKKAIGFMDVSYSRLKLTITAEEKKLRMIKNKKYEELWSDEEAVLVKWYDALASCCVYSNFRADYDIHNMLGKGNFAKVYLVEDRTTKKQFAAKIFDKNPIKDDEFEKVDLK